MRTFDVAHLEFLRVPALNMGVYALAAGAEDVGEKVHPTEDEMNYVLAGRAVLRTPAAARLVRPGEVVFVPAGVEHRFERIAADLALLVFLAPVLYRASGRRRYGLQPDRRPSGVPQYSTAMDAAPGSPFLPLIAWSFVRTFGNRRSVP